VNKGVDLYRQSKDVVISWEAVEDKIGARQPQWQVGDGLLYGGLVGSVLGSVLFISVRMAIPRKAATMQLTQMARHLRVSAENSRSKLSYDHAERTYQHANSLLRRRPRMFDVTDRALLANEEALATISEMRGNFTDATTKLQNAMAFHPRGINPASFRFYPRVAKLQNHMAQGRCLFKSQQTELARMELDRATRVLKSLSWSFNVVPNKRWYFLCEVEKEIEFLKALNVYFSKESIPEIRSAMAALLRLLEFYNPKLSSFVAKKLENYELDDSFPVTALALLRETPTEKNAFPLNTFRAATIMFAMANMYRRGADYLEFPDAREQWLKSSLYLHLTIIPFLKEIAFKAMPLKIPTPTWRDRIRDKYWPPTLIETGLEYSPEMLFQKLISAISTLAQVRIQLHDYSASPREAQEHAEKSYQELAEAYALICQRLYNRDLALKSRLTLWLGAAARRTHRAHEARHAYKMASTLISVLPKNTDGYVSSVRLLGMAHMHTGLMHLAYGEVQEASKLRAAFSGTVNRIVDGQVDENIFFEKSSPERDYKSNMRVLGSSSFSLCTPRLKVLISSEGSTKLGNYF